MFSKIVRIFAEKIQKIPIKKCMLAFGIILAGLLVVVLVIPRNVTFSYATDTCIREVTFFPKQHTTLDSSHFSIEYKDLFGQLLSLETCFAPTSAPKSEEASVASTVFGWSFFQHHYHISVGEQPYVVGSRTKAPIAVTMPVIFTIDKPDTVHSYSVINKSNTQQCTVASTQLTCHIDKLGLQQGADQTISLTRSFKEGSSTNIATETVSILPAVKITDSSVKQNQVVYDKPTTFSLTTDKPLVSSTAKLELVDGNTQSNIEIKVSVKDTSILVATTSELAREKQYRLTLETAIATDGSTVNEPYAIPFATSGGPKVTGVNISSSGVDPSMRIVVTLDQTIAENVDITKFASITGTTATVTKQGNQVVYALKNVARCTAFSLKIIKGITSATNGLVSTADWSYSSRVNCRATSVIGYSVKGRPITAYFYGSGATTILFTGGMHGSEPSGQQTMQAWATYLDTHAPEIPADKQVVIVPNTNPDGIVAGSRYNSRNVNIARNFSTADWTADIDTSSGTLAGGGGASPMSEPETQAIGALTLQLNPRLEVSYHASGRLVGANDIADSRAIGSMYASTVGYSTMFGSSAEETMGYGFSGQYEDYIGQKLGKPAILIELPTASGNYLNSQLPALWKMVSL